jgi:hypothetical protein
MKNYQQAVLKLSMTICLTAFLLLGCTSPISAENYQKIQNGMTLEQVKAVLGEPTEAKTAGIGPLSGTAATWKQGDLTISIQFLNNKVQLKSMTGGK